VQPSHGEEALMQNIAVLNLIAIPENFGADSPEWTIICDHLHKQLNAERELTVSVPPPSATPKNAKGEPITIGALLIALTSAPAVIKLAQSLNTWIASLGNRKVRVEITSGNEKVIIDAKAVSGADVDRLLNSVSKALQK
jgi:hypothetical protein